MKNKYFKLLSSSFFLNFKYANESPFQNPISKTFGNNFD